MKWFKHDTSARNDTRIKLLKKKFGAEGYGVYFQMLEIVGENIKEANHEEWGFVESIHTIETLADESGVSPDKLRQILLFMNEIGLLYKIGHQLCAPKILTRLDEYANKRKGKFDVFERKNELDRQYKDSVGTQSGESRGLEIEQNRTEQKKNNIPRFSNDGSSEKKKKEKCPIEDHQKCVDFLTSLAKQKNLKDGKWLNFGKQLSPLHKMLRAGYTFDEIRKVAVSFDKDNFMWDKWDVSTIASKIERQGREVVTHAVSR